MPPVSKRLLSPKVRSNIYELLIRSFSKTYKKQDLLPFISDLLTPTEQIMVSKRLAIALLLIRKDYDQRQISKILKVSTSTVCRINLVLNTKGEGYRNILNKVLRDENMKLILSEIYDVFTPFKGSDREVWESRRKILKRNMKSF